MVSGCGREAPQAQPAATPPDVPLPDWAPENPSPEFLRAARVLKPMPPEVLEDYAEGDAEYQETLRRATATYPAAYEFFGTLSDREIERFLTSEENEIRIPAKSLTPKQRAALDNWFEVWRQVMKGTMYPDFMVILYKTGAEEGLSNVQVGFDARGGHAVHITFWIALPTGDVIPVRSHFAMI